MKINIKSLRGRKQTYYYEHQHGVLQRKKTSSLRIASSLMASVFVIGSVGVLSLQILDRTQSQQATPTAGLQRQAVSIDTTKKESEQDKLKSVEKKAREDEQLAKNVKTKLKNIPGGQKWSVYIRDVKSDRMASINADTQFDAASLGNLFTIPALEAKQPAANWNYRIGKSTIAQCVPVFISANDPTCKTGLVGYANIANANSVLSGHGFKKTTITAKEQKTTARDTGELLFRLQNGQVLGDKARRAVFDGLYSQKQREGIPKGCDQTCLTANITGESDSVRHDAAIVTTSTSQYVVVVMTKGGTWSQIADLSADIRNEMQP